MKRWIAVAIMILATCGANPRKGQAVVPTAYWGTHGSGPGQFDFLSHGGISISQDGRVFVTDPGNTRVQVFSTTGVFLYQWGTPGQAAGQFSTPQNIAIGPGGAVYVSDPHGPPLGGVVQVFAEDSAFVRRWPTDPTGGEPLNGPDGIGCASDGTVYVGDSFNSRLRRFDSSGTVLSSWGSFGIGAGQFGALTSIAVDAGGFVYVADGANSRIQKFTPTGTWLTMWGSLGSTGHGKFDSGPTGVAVDENGYIYATDARRVQVFAPDGTFVDEWGGVYGSAPGEFHDPGAIAIGPNGLVYVLDTGNSRVQVFTRPSTPTLKTSWGKLKAAYR